MMLFLLFLYLAGWLNPTLLFFRITDGLYNAHYFSAIVKARPRISALKNCIKEFALFNDDLVLVTSAMSSSLAKVSVITMGRAGQYFCKAGTGACVRTIDPEGVLVFLIKSRRG